MATEIYNDLKLQKKTHLDSRLEAVANVSSLPDPNLNTNFIYEGAVIWVKDVELNYQAQETTTPGVLAWVNIGGAATTAQSLGTINIVPTTTILDLSLVSPAIENCHSVNIVIAGGTSALITSITNWPTVSAGENRLITFYTEAGKTVTFNHTDYDVATTDQIVIEDGFDFDLNGRTIGNDSITFKKHTNSICQWKATQFLKSSELMQNLLNIAIVDNLTTTDSNKALSANQGKILKDLVDQKQHMMTGGDHITVNQTVDPATITADPWLWQSITTPPDAPISVSAYLTGVFGSTQQDKYRYSDLRVFNQGLWVLPAKTDGSVYGNWINFDAVDKTAVHGRFSFNGHDPLTSNLYNGNTIYIPQIRTTTYQGGNLGITFNADGPPNDKISFSLPTGTYRIEAKLFLMSDHLNDYTLSIYSLPAIAQAATGLPATKSLVDFDKITTDITTTDTEGVFNVVVSQVITSSSYDAFVLALSSTADFINSKTHTTFAGWIDITKLS